MLTLIEHQLRYAIVIALALGLLGYHPPSVLSLHERFLQLSHPDKQDR